LLDALARQAVVPEFAEMRRLGRVAHDVDVADDAAESGVWRGAGRPHCGIETRIRVRAGM
jgi:hypothetical protein